MDKTLKQSEIGIPRKIWVLHEEDYENRKGRGEKHRQVYPFFLTRIMNIVNVVFPGLVVDA